MKPSRFRKRQASTSLPDGELRRYAFYGHLIDSLSGFDKLGGWAIPFRDESGEELILLRPVVVEKLQWKRSMCAEEWVYFRAHHQARQSDDA